MKVKFLFVVMLVLLATLPLLVGMKYLNSKAGNYARKQYENHLSSMSLVAKQRVLAAIDRINDNTSLVASRTQLRISLTEWAKTRDPSHLSKINKIISDAKYGLKHLIAIGIYDADGVLATSTSSDLAPELLETPETASEKIKLVLKNDAVYAVKLTPLILNHARVGYLRIVFSTSFISDLVRDRTGLGQTGEWLIGIRDESGDAIFAVPLKYDNKAALKRRISKHRTDAPLVQALQGNEIIMNFASDYRGEPVLASTRYIKDLDWGLVAKINEAEVGELVSENNFVIYIAGISICIVALFTGLVLTFVIFNPIQKLNLRAKNVAQGNGKQPQKYAGWNDVKELTSHFDFMINSLKDLNQDLQCKVDERTKELNAANEKLRQMAAQDPLTGLRNRREFDIRYALEFDRAIRYQRPLAIAIIDIDWFKSINDLYGHVMGDQVIKQVTSTMSISVRESDTLARIGGEEFCIILPECSGRAAVEFVERIREKVGEMVFYHEKNEFNVSCSAGVAYLRANQDKETLFKNADDALYRAKTAGRNKVVLFEPELNVVYTKDRDHGEQ